MENWKNEMENFLKEKGISKSIIEFTGDEEHTIKNFIDDSVKDAFHQIENELNLYPNFKINVMTSKKKHDSIYEDIELKIVGNSQILFTYKPTFLKDSGVVKVIFKFSVPNLYNESKSFSDSNLNQAINETSVQSILDDFTSCLKNNFKVN